MVGRHVVSLTKASLYLKRACLLPFCIEDTAPLKCQSKFSFSRPLKGTTAGIRAQDHRIPHCYLITHIPSLCAVYVNHPVLTKVKGACVSLFNFLSKVQDFPVLLSPASLIYQE